MRTGTVPSGLVKIASGALALLVGAFASAAKAADGPGTTPPAATSAASADGGTVAVATTGTAAMSPDDPKPADAPPDFLHSIQVDGFVDGYYGWAFNKVGPQVRNFDINHNNFSLNYVELAISKAPTDKSRAGFRVDFGAGDTANLVNLFEPGGKEYLKYVQQAYVSYLAGKVSLDFGKFVPPMGAEVIESKDNFNYSRG